MGVSQAKLELLTAINKESDELINNINKVTLEIYSDKSIEGYTKSNNVYLQSTSV